jgi:hypothetical protein
VVNSVDLRLTAFGEEAINRTLFGVSARMDDVTPALNQLMVDFQEAEVEQFSTAGQFGSGGWLELADSTVTQKRREGLDNGILIRTGYLQDALTLGDAPGAIREVSNTVLVFGADVDYGEYHQQGRGVPQRRPFELPEQVRQDAVKTLQRYIITGEL